MATPHRRTWMNKYMRNYRGDPERSEKLRMAHRFDSFLWRLSQFLSPQYDILMCEQAGPFRASDERDATVRYENKNTKYENDSNDTTETHIFTIFPGFMFFYLVCEPGGGDIFKVFSYVKFYLNKEPIKVVWGLVGTLDKQALLNHLRNLTQEERIVWEGLIKRLITEKERVGWQEIKFMHDNDADYHWQAEEWAPHDDPDWSSVQLHTFLRMWKGGRRRIGKRVESESWDNGLKWRLIASPIFDAMRSAVVEARGHGSRP